MIIIGLTGLIASGKTTVSEMFTAKSIPVHNADKVVHRLLGPHGDAIEKIITAFGAEMGDFETGIDRGKLGAHVFADKKSRSILESILHPMVSDDRDDFLQMHRQASTPFVVLDIPLLFETGGDKLCDYVIVTNAHADTIADRALSRPGMTRSKLVGILQNQMPATDKIARADLVLDTDMSIAQTQAQLESWLESLALARAEQNKPRSV